MINVGDKAGLALIFQKVGFINFVHVYIEMLRGFVELYQIPRVSAFTQLLFTDKKPVGFGLKSSEKARTKVQIGFR